MPKKIRWGRVSAALSTLALTPVFGVGLLWLATPPPLIQSSPGMGGADCDAAERLSEGHAMAAARCARWSAVENPMPVFTAARDELDGLELDLERGRAVQAAVGALEIWSVGVRLQREGTIVDAAVGSAIALKASEVVHGALTSEDLPHDELHGLAEQLEAVGADALDPLALASRERAASWALAWRATRTGWPLQALAVLWQGAGWGGPGDALMQAGVSGPRRLEVRGRAKNGAERLLVDVMLDSEGARNRANALAWTARLRAHLEHAEACPAEITEVVKPVGSAPWTWDAASCTLAVTVHPEQPPLLATVRLPATRPPEWRSR